MERRPNNRSKFRKIKKAMEWTVALVIVVAVIGGIYLFMHSASFSRGWKSVKSNYTGGLNRKVTVYDMQGHPIKEYKGKFDIEESNTKVYFDMEDGSRVQIWNGVVISEEEK